jgi:hypothetical protein
MRASQLAASLLLLVTGLWCVAAKSGTSVSNENKVSYYCNASIIRITYSMHMSCF